MNAVVLAAIGLAVAVAIVIGAPLVIARRGHPEKAMLVLDQLHALPDAVVRWTDETVRAVHTALGRSSRRGMARLKLGGSTAGGTAPVQRHWWPGLAVIVCVFSAVWAVAFVVGSRTDQQSFEKAGLDPTTARLYTMLVLLAVTIVGAYLADILGVARLLPIAVERWSKRARAGAVAAVLVLLAGLLGLQGFLVAGRADQRVDEAQATADKLHIQAALLAQRAGYNPSAAIAAEGLDKEATRIVEQARREAMRDRVSAWTTPMLAGTVEVATSWAPVTLLCYAILALIGLGRVLTGALNRVLVLVATVLDRLYQLHVRAMSGPTGKGTQPTPGPVAPPPPSPPDPEEAVPGPEWIGW